MIEEKLMGAGYVYILINKSLDGLIKIGSTTLGARERAMQLSSSTGVPTPFIVAYELYVDNCTKLEKQIHNQLDEFRVNPKREFFKYPLYKAIELIQKLNKDDTVTNIFEAIEISSSLLARYGNSIEASISSMRIYQNDERVYFEFTKDEYIAGYLKDQIITRIDLGFITESDGNRMFNVEKNIEVNVDKFLALDDYSMLNCVDKIFTKEWITRKLKA